MCVILKARQLSCPDPRAEEARTACEGTMATAVPEGEGTPLQAVPAAAGRAGVAAWVKGSSSSSSELCLIFTSFKAPVSKPLHVTVTPSGTEQTKPRVDAGSLGPCPTVLGLGRLMVSGRCRSG